MKKLVVIAVLVGILSGCGRSPNVDPVEVQNEVVLRLSQARSGIIVLAAVLGEMAADGSLDRERSEEIVRFLSDDLSPWVDRALEAAENVRDGDEREAVINAIDAAIHAIPVIESRNPDNAVLSASLFAVSIALESTKRFIEIQYPDT